MGNQPVVTSPTQEFRAQSTNVYVARLKKIARSISKDFSRHFSRRPYHLTLILTRRFTALTRNPYPSISLTTLPCALPSGTLQELIYHVTRYYIEAWFIFLFDVGDIQVKKTQCVTSNGAFSNPPESFPLRLCEIRA